MRDARLQIAAMPLRWSKGGVKVLMITSRDTGRWIVPKGWTMSKTAPWDAAAIEALEEAGAVGRIARESCGTYDYDKILDDGTSVPVHVDVYPMLVDKLKRRWKERDERKRRWFPAASAAKRVDEPELAALLRALARRPEKVPVAGPMLRGA
jgi:8-oxo-dGTP pyrophosphatase MutT (NUDIX family)